MSAMWRKYSYKYMIVCAVFKEIERDVAIIAVKPQEPLITAISTLLPSVLIKDIN